MVAKEITSVHHSLVKQAVQLRTERSAREERQQVLLSGKKLILDLAPTWPLDILFFTDLPPNLPAHETIQVSSSVLKKITGLQTPDGWAAIVPAPKPQSLKDKSYLLILDQVADPGNFGTLWRTALALGWEGVWLTPGCVDPLNDKALRAARGATFHLPYEYISPEEIATWATHRKASLFLADLEGAPLSSCPITAPLALVLSHEGRGPRNWPTSLAKRVAIPMAHAVESLNVASAGAILLYTMRPSR